LSSSIDKLEDRMREQTILSVITVRLTPGLRQAPSLAAGSLKISYFKFAIGVLWSSIIYDLIAILMAFLAKLGLKRISAEPTPFIFAALVITMALMWVIMYFLFKRRQKD
jgi:membrane protein DedA with SNARE-associated domain